LRDKMDAGGENICVFTCFPGLHWNCILKQKSPSMHVQGAHRRVVSQI
jgi:hypothetical protein